MQLWMEEARIWIFLGMMVAFALVSAWGFVRMRTRAGAQVESAHEQLRGRGFAAEQTADGHGRSFVRIWGRLARPVGLRLRIASRGLAGRLLSTLSDARTANSHFEERFRVKSSDPSRLPLLLTPDLQQQLLALGPKIDFRIGSPDSLLTPEYWPEDPAERKLRGLWMIRVRGTLGKKIPVEQLAAVAAALAQAVCAHSLEPATPNRGAFETTAAEGQWL